MEIDAETVNNDVLLKQKRPQESRANTSLVNKIRSSTRLRSRDDDLQSILQPASASKSTGTGNLETPRRSARKSVRPQMDYEDIVVNVLRSGSKSARDITATETAAAAEPEEAGTAQKWNVAEVGRNSRKRSRKSKRAASKGAKKQREECTANEEEQEEQCAEKVEELQAEKCTDNGIEQQEKSIIEINVEVQQEQCIQEVAEQQKEKRTSTGMEQVEEQQEECIQEVDEQQNENYVDTGVKEVELQEEQCINQVEEQQEQQSVRKSIMLEQSMEICTPEQEEKVQTMEVKEQEVEAVPKELEPQVKEQSCTKSTVPKISPRVSCSPTAVALAVDIEDMEELGLCPLTADNVKETAQDEDNDEMPTLLLPDVELQLNTTFEIDNETSDQPLNAVEQLPEDMDMDMPKLQMSPEKAHIKIVLTNENEQDQTLLRMDNSQVVSPKNKAYRFPTPAKNSMKINFNFTAVHGSPKHLELMESTLGRRRSKSVSNLQGDKKKNVCFFSPVEITAVNEIDKRLEKFNVSNVTQRRKRSKSLDDHPFIKSRIPKPKFVPVIKAPTPVKLKTRTKLPNFAAIHEKQFKKMENLVDHMERKAVRAKELTSSAIKLVNATASAQKSSTKKLPNVNTLNANRSRPRAQKKIVLASDILSPLKPEELQLKMNLPTPRKIIGTQTKSRLPLLSKSSTKIFSANPIVPPTVAPAATAPAPASAATTAPLSFQGKMEARRQRHMQMFKGRFPKTEENRSDLIRGVRSNRRFQLQMEHRRQMNANNKT